MYADYGGFGQDYFEGAEVDNPHPAGYRDYRPAMLPFKWYAEFLYDELISMNMNPEGEKVLVVGCAYGYVVDFLINDWNVDAYGMDISQWAVDNAPASISDRIYQGDARNASDMEAIRKNTKGGHFAAIYNECVLECLSDSSAVTMRDNMRSESKYEVFHRVWSTDGSDLNTEWYNGKDIAEWQSLVDPNGEDHWYTEEEFQPL